MNIDFIIDNIDGWIGHFLSTPASIIAIFIGAAGVSILTQVVKKLGKLQNDKVITAVFITVSFLASALDYIISATDLPPTILGVSTMVLIGAATPVYRYVIKPLNIVLTKYRQYQAQIAAKVSELEAVNKVSAIEHAVLTEETKTETGEVEKTSVNTPITVPAVKPVEQKENIVYF